MFKSLIEPEERPYQKRIITTTTNTYKELVGKAKVSTVMISAPTGSGKTYMGFSCIKNILLNSEQLLNKKPEDVTIGWCAMRRNLLKQAEEDNIRLVGIPNIQYISMFTKQMPKLDILIMDESHHSACTTAVDITTESEAKIILGLTATPFRTDHVKLCYHKVIIDAGYRSLIEQGYLSQYNQWTIDNWTPETVANTYIQNKNTWGKSIIFFLTAEECYKTKNLLLNKGIKADVITAETNREKQLDDFDEGKIDVMLNMAILTEGYDCKNLQTVFVRPSVKGPTLQMCGRVLRKLPGKIANIVQSINTNWPFTKTATPTKQYIYKDNEWITIGKNEKLDNIINTNRSKISLIDIKLPKMLLNKQKRSFRTQIDNE